MPESSEIPTVGRTQATPTLYNNLVRDSARLLSVSGGTKTISAGAITIAPGTNGEGYYLVDTQGAAATDDLDTITGGVDGDMVVLRQAVSGRATTVKASGGNISLEVDVTLDSFDKLLVLRYDGTNWRAVSGAGAAGGTINLTNKSGGQLIKGDVVIWDKGNTEAITTTTVAKDRRVAGVADATIPNDAAGPVRFSGRGVVNSSQALAIGDALYTHTVAKQAAKSGGAKGLGFLAYAMQAIGGAGLVNAFIQAEMGQYGASIVVEGSVNTSGLNTSGGSDNLNCGSASNRYVFACVVTHGTVGLGSGLIPQVGGVNMTPLGAGTHTGWGIDGFVAARLFYYVSPATGTVAVTGGHYHSAGSSANITSFIALSGVGSFASPVLDTLTTGTPSISAVDSLPGDLYLAFDFMGVTSGVSTAWWVSVGSGQTEFQKSVRTGGGASVGISSSHEVAASTTEQSTWTLDTSRKSGMLAIPVRPV